MAPPQTVTVDVRTRVQSGCEAHRRVSAFQRLGGGMLIALEGTEYFGSHKTGCSHSQG